MAAQTTPAVAPTAPGPAANSLDTPIEKLCADPAAKDVVDRDLPGLTTRPEYPEFKGLSLKALATLSGGKINKAKLDEVAADLAKLSPSTPSNALPSP